MYATPRPELSVGAARFATNHVFLPPNLPQSGDDAQDPKVVAVEREFLTVVSQSLGEFSRHVDADFVGTIETARSAIDHLLMLRDSHGYVDEVMLKEAFRNLVKNGGYFPIHVKAQNAAVIMSYEQDAVILESFELSPENEATMKTEGRLRRLFPGSSVSIPMNTFNRAEFQKTLAHTIATMSHQEAAEMKPKVMKAGNKQIEERDTTNPALVTDLLVTVLRAVGKMVDRPLITKNTREEVLWDNALLPWRRSPVWLLVRVTLHLFLSRAAPDQTLYKQYMVSLMAHVLMEKAVQELPSDTLYCLVAKISRRLLKMGRGNTYAWTSKVEKAMSDTISRVENCGKEIRERADPDLDLQCLSTLPFDQHVYTSYPELDKFIQQIESRQITKHEDLFQPPWEVRKYDNATLPSIPSASTFEATRFALLAFEDWVASSLDSWLEIHAPINEACEQLYTAMRSYHQSASKHYSSDPEDFSLMILTVVEMWVACDKLACGQHALLLEYNPEVPHELLENLILPLKEQAGRLVRLETYIQRRRARTDTRNPSVLSSFGDTKSFSVRFFANSAHHQQLLQDIEKDANRKRELKREEFRERKAEYQRYMKLYNEAKCQYDERVNRRTGIMTEEHRSPCLKCSHLNRAQNITIDVHEWPLPTDRLKAQSTVFELNTPKPFNAWRCATTYLLKDVLGSNYVRQQRSQYVCTMQSYLRSFNSTDASRLILVSTTKSNQRTHRRGKTLELATENDVLVHNGLSYEYFDDQARCFVSNFKTTDKIPLKCTYQLSKECSTLQDFLFRPSPKPNGLSPNDVISKQADCPDRLSLTEFKAMAALPVGYRIQWTNILTQLFMPAVDFKKLDTGLILLQICRQAGPPSGESPYRASHERLSDEAFVQRFLEGLSLALDRIKENWDSYYALSAFISLAARLLTLGPSSPIESRCLEFLQICRAVALNWVHNLQLKIKQAEVEEERAEFLRKTFEVAHICVSTFDIDDKHVRKVLANSIEAGKLIEASIIIQNSTNTAMDSEDVFHCYSAARWRRLMYRCRPNLIQEIVEEGNSCLAQAIKASWSAYPGGEKWEVLSAKAGHWLVNAAASPSGTHSHPSMVHFNVLTAELLVNGLPLARLPANYEQHPSYRALFGKTTMEVMPANVPGMHFSSKTDHHDYTVFFGISNSSQNELLLMAGKGGQTIDMIPSRVFHALLPDHFIYDYIHWYDHDSHTIEFRSKNAPWASSTRNWGMSKIGSSWVLKKEDRSLISPSSYTARKIVHLLTPLENEAHIHLVHDPALRRADIDMPRLQLGFFLETGSTKLQSRQYRGMYLDPVRSIGTLFGMNSKLVLTNDRNQRKLLLPNGRITYAAGDRHVEVSVHHGTSNKAFAYDIDTMLGRLVNEDFQSRLVLCYLHALTSYCLPDPFTGNTGTEEALSILDSASMRSFTCLTRDNLDILQRIAKLSPGRAYYPPYERVMETVAWDNTLSPLSQHSSFYTSVKSILAQSSSIKFFYPETYLQPPNVDHVNEQLGRRHAIRASTFQISGFGAEDHTGTSDVIYKGRDHLSSSGGSILACQISTMIHEERRSLLSEVSLGFAGRLWSILAGGQSVQGPAGSSKLAEDIRYDKKWLGDMKSLLRKCWCQLHRELAVSSISHVNKFRTMLCLATMAYSGSCDPETVLVLAAFSLIPSIQQIPVPDFPSFALEKGRAAKTSTILNITRNHLVPFQSCPEASLLRRDRESQKQLQNRRASAFRTKQNNVIQDFASFIEHQWLCEIPRNPEGNDFATYIYIAQAMLDIQSTWKSWYQNHLFYQYLQKVETALRQCSVSPISIPRWRNETEILLQPDREKPFVTAQDVFGLGIPSLPGALADVLDICTPAAAKEEKGEKLEALVQRLQERASREHEREYVQDLKESQQSLKAQHTLYSLDGDGQMLRNTMQQHLARCWAEVDLLYSTLEAAVQSHGGSPAAKQMAMNFMRPRVSPSFLLRQLSRTHWQALSAEWKKAVVAYALALSRLQRAQRMSTMYEYKGDLIKELLNPGHTNWDPLDYPGSLLLEVESGFMIRPVQEEIAKQMREPPQGDNRVMQLNMGEGKSSVIVPIVAAHLADGTRLVVVVVAKPQAKELFRTLISKLGGMLGRRIYQMPCSRSLRLSASEANEVKRIYKECMEKGGVLLVQPEHMLSFKLMGLEYMEAGKTEVGSLLLDTQHFFNMNSRAIVDESDENFNVKFELIYTMGMQRPIELSPDRWAFVQRLLTTVARTALVLRKELPDSIEVTHYIDGGFPRTRILRDDAHHSLLSKVAQEICTTGLPNFPMARQPSEVRAAVFEYISSFHLSSEQIAAVEGNPTLFTESIRDPLLLLRGLIAGGVLSFILSQKRWRVNYGLDLNRQPKTRLAVPYRAKDNPTARSEFSHPDVVIALTCLSYYYGGLSDEGLILAFAHLRDSDQADIEYAQWVKDAPTLPTAFRVLMGVNMKDRFQAVNQIFPHLRFAKSVVDYFLAHIVFPKEMKEFPQKVSASGWDIGQRNAHPTTGFSGTNDSRHLLPLSVNHLDLEEQRHTNALVLEYLLQPENTVASLSRPRDTQSSDAKTLLTLVISMEHPVQVILDVGAQILELTNIQVAQTWLDMMPAEQGKEAVVFFNDHDDLCVVDRKGHVEYLQTSPYYQQLDVCLVFLDEAHTRGTDLKLPENYRAAVTLGANLTKDRLVQACMRMRKLGKGQSVVFCVPGEIQGKIRIATGSASHTPIDVSDVLLWAVTETYADLRRGMPLWAMQGARFERQAAIWSEVTCPTGIQMSSQQAGRFLEDDAQSLEYRYRPATFNEEGHGLTAQFSDLEKSANLTAIQERCEKFASLHFKSSALQEEQERELSPEIQQERQVEKPQPARPAKNSLHPHVSSFVRDGTVPQNSAAFIPAFRVLENTSAAQRLSVDHLPRDILVTADYKRTVILASPSANADSYQRPIEWILTSHSPLQGVHRLIIISPYEAQELIPEVEKSRVVFMHLYAPQLNLGFSPLDDLKLYTIPQLPFDWRLPQHLRLQLNLFAGQLYFSSFGDYRETCQMLGLAWKPAEEGIVVEADGFVVSKAGEVEVGSRKSPVSFLKVLLMKIRRDCEGIDKTHWGRILGGEILTEVDFA